MDSMWIQWERICLLVVNGNDSDGCNHANHNCNCGRYDPIPTGHHSDCQLKQVIGHIWTGPTSQRQYTAFFKLIALQNLDFICKNKNQLLLILTLLILWNFNSDDLMGIEKRTICLNLKASIVVWDRGTKVDSDSQTARVASKPLVDPTWPDLTMKFRLKMLAKSCDREFDPKNTETPES